MSQNPTPEENPLPPIDTGPTDAAGRPATQLPTQMNMDVIRASKVDLTKAHERGAIDLDTLNAGLKAADTLLSVLKWAGLGL